MLTYLSSSIWASPAQTLVNTVNVVGAMGKGIALEFKRKYPEMYQRYREFKALSEFQRGVRFVAWTIVRSLVLLEGREGQGQAKF